MPDPSDEAWIDRFAELAGLPQDVRDMLHRRSRRASLPAGAHVFRPGQPAEAMLLLLSGSVRVQQVSDSGREIFLYRVQAGESCVLTTACMLADEDYSAEGIAETAVQAVVIPRAGFDELVGRSAIFRSFIFRAYGRRIADLFGLIDAIVFQRMDVRLAQRLLDMESGGVIVATHQAVAVELGTAREVVSRTLAEFHRRGWVETARGEIRILDRQGLRRMASSVT